MSSDTNPGRNTPASSRFRACSQAEKTSSGRKVQQLAAPKQQPSGPNPSGALLPPGLCAFSRPRPGSPLPAGSHQSGADGGSRGAGRKPAAQRGLGWRPAGLPPSGGDGGPGTGAALGEPGPRASRAGRPPPLSARPLPCGGRGDPRARSRGGGGGSVRRMRRAWRGARVRRCSAPWSCFGRAGSRVSRRCWRSRCFPGERWVSVGGEGGSPGPGPGPAPWAGLFPRWAGEWEQEGPWGERGPGPRLCGQVPEGRESGGVGAAGGDRSWRAGVRGPVCH